jgi:alpha-glucosidase
MGTASEISEGSFNGSIIWSKLGIDTVWLSPIFPSPMADFGYDIADFRDIDPLFGSLKEFDDLLAAAHSRGLKLLLDLVP